MQAVILNKIARAKGKSNSALHASLQDGSEMHAKTGSKVKSLHVRKISMQEPVAACMGHCLRTLISTSIGAIFMGAFMRQ